MTKTIEIEGQQEGIIRPNKKQTKGILLIALGHWRYGEMAANLAMSIKFKEQIPIALYCTDWAISTLADEHKELFDIIIPAKEGLNPFGEKLRINEITPFDKTIFLDVDTLVLPEQKLAQLFDLVNNEQQITYQNRGFILAENATSEHSIWCNAGELKVAYKLAENARIYSLHSEVVIWQNSDQANKFFKEAKKAFDKPKVDTTIFGGGVADEFGYMVAAAMLQQYPHQDNWICSFWAMAEKWPRTVSELYSKYILMSMGGNRMPQEQIAQYNNLAKHYSSKLGLRQYFAYKNKRNFLRERNTL